MIEHFKFGDFVKALLKTWQGLVALLLLVALAGATISAFATGNIALGAILLLATVAYGVALFYLMAWAFALAMFMGAVLGVILRGLFPYMR